MRFNQLFYSHTDILDNGEIEEIKFVGLFNDDEDSMKSVEIWIQEDSVNCVMVDNTTNELDNLTEKEEEFIISYAKELKLI